MNLPFSPRVITLHEARTDLPDLERAVRRTKPKGGYDRLVLRVSVESASECGSETHAALDLDMETARRLMPVLGRVLEQEYEGQKLSAWARRRTRYHPAYARIEERICRALNVGLVDLLSPSRRSDLAFARQAIVYWTCRLTRLSLPAIARRLNRKDHTTILHARRVYVEKRAAMGRHLRDLEGDSCRRA